MGYSWLDGHIPVFGNVGIGWPIVWRRWVLVMIGMLPDLPQFNVHHF